MSFDIILNYVSQPKLIYEGAVPDKIILKEEDSIIKGHNLVIDWAKPECKVWRHYYSDKELNILSQQLKFGLRFCANSEMAVNETTGLGVIIQPFFSEKYEYSICFSYTELAQCYGQCFLNAILKREMDKKDFAERVKQIKKYWLK